MTYISFELKNCNVGSWNSVDTGDKQNHFVVRRMSDKEYLSRFSEIIPKGERKFFHYDFGDGWSVNVIAEVVDSKEARQRKAKSNGFRGREWMIDEIFKYGRIRTRKERYEAEAAANSTLKRTA